MDDDELDAMNHFHELPDELQDVLADWPARRAVSRGEEAMTHAENRTNATIDWGRLHEELARPFPDAAIKYRVGAVSKDKKTAQALPYVDPRAYEDRLNELVPGAWSVAFEPWGADRIICRLTIHGVTRSSTGDGAGSPDQVAGTAAEAQAFKRAASKFGLGRHLYDLCAPWVDYDHDRRTIRPPRPAHPQVSANQPGPQVTKPTPSPAPDEPDTLGRTRAATMHRELARLGLPRSKHTKLARRVLGWDVQDLAALTEPEARRIWIEAQPQEPRSRADRTHAQTIRGPS